MRPLTIGARKGQPMTSTKIMDNGISATYAEDQKQTMRRRMMQNDEIASNTIHASDDNRLDILRTPPIVAHTPIVTEQIACTLVGRTVADVERDLILETLKHCLGNRTHAANILGVSIRTLRNKLNEYADGGLPITPAGATDCPHATATA